MASKAQIKFTPDEKTVEVLELGRRGYERAGLYKKNEQLTSPLLIRLQIPLEAIFLPRDDS